MSNAHLHPTFENVVRDFKATPERVASAIETSKPLVRCRVTFTIGGGLGTASYEGLFKTTFDALLDAQSKCGEMQWGIRVVALAPINNEQREVTA